ncbi:MAG TPA: hypothetical protein VF365_03840 [Candidatus Limnocylindria bacterium]
MNRAVPLVIVAVLASGCGGAGEGSSSPAASGSLAPLATSSGSTESAAPSAQVSSSAAPSDSLEGPDAGTRLETNGRSPSVVTAWRDGFAALGEDLIWISADGVAWDVAETTGIEGAVVDVVERTDGHLLAFGYRDVRDTDAFRTWVSDDGVAWAETQILPGEFVFLDVAYGGRGYVLAGRALLDTGGPNPEQLWYSADARTWELVRDTRTDKMLAAVGAGSEGFVAVGQQGWQSGDPRGLVVASSDGTTWLEAPGDDTALAGVGSLWTVAALGGDWLTIPLTTGDELPILWSANGLAWEARSSLPVEPVDSGILGNLYSDGSRLFMGIADGGGRTVTSADLLTSGDAVTWTPTDIPRPAMPNAYAESGGMILFLVDGVVYVTSR